MTVRRAFVLAFAVALLVPLSAQAAPGGKPGEGASKGGGSGCNLPESNAEGLEILSNYYPGYWWDHRHLTIAVQAHPSATQEQLAAVRDAIDTWDEVLRDCFDGLITLTDVTG
jgi:hypothetical protein